MKPNLCIRPLVAALIPIACAPQANAAEFLIPAGNGNNSTDNAPVINGIIANLPPEGGVIVIPAGEFLIRSPIDLAGKNNVTIRGINYGQRSNDDVAVAGVSAPPACGSKIILGPGVGQGIRAANGSPAISGLIIRDLAIQGGDGPGFQTGISIDCPNSGTRVMDVSCINLEEGAFIRAADHAVIEDCWLAECRSPLFLLTGSDNRVADSSFGGQPQGIACKFEGQQRLMFTGNGIFADGHTGILLKTCDNCNVSHNTVTGWFTGLVQVEGNMNTLVNNNITGVLDKQGNWPADPQGRDDQFGLVRVTGNDNLVASSVVMSWQPVNHVRIRNHSGDRNVFRNLYIAANASTRKIFVNAAATTATRITHCGWQTDIDLNGSATATVTYDP